MQQLEEKAPKTWEYLGKTIFFINCTHDGKYYIDSMEVYAVSKDSLFDKRMRNIEFISIFDNLDEASEELAEEIDDSLIIHQFTIDEV